MGNQFTLYDDTPDKDKDSKDFIVSAELSDVPDVPDVQMSGGRTSEHLMPSESSDQLEEKKQRLINALEVDEKMSTTQAPMNIVEYMQIAEEQELAEVQTPEPEPEPKLDNKVANMRTVIKRFDDIENKINTVIELLSKDTGESNE